MATIRIITAKGQHHTALVRSNRTSEIVRGAKQCMPEAHAAVFSSVFGSPVAKYKLYDKAGAFLGDATYIA